MPVVIQYTSRVGVEEYDQVASRIRFHDEVPPGLLIHTAAVTESGQMRVIDVWRTQEDHDRFAEARLGPAIAEVVGADEAGQAELEVLQLHSVVGPLLPLSLGRVGHDHRATAPVRFDQLDASSVPLVWTGTGRPRPCPVAIQRARAW